MLSFDQPGPTRLTNYIRQYGNVCKDDDIPDEISVPELLLERKENRTPTGYDGVSWSRIKAGINEATRNTDISLNCYIRDIYEVGRKVVARIPAPRFPKARSEGWFLLAGVGSELAALRRVPGRGRAALTLLAPAVPGNATVTVYLMSDGLMGLDQQYAVPLRVVECPEGLRGSYGEEEWGEEVPEEQEELTGAAARKAQAFDENFPALK